MVQFVVLFELGDVDGAHLFVLVCDFLFEVRVVTIELLGEGDSRAGSVAEGYLGARLDFLDGCHARFLTLQSVVRHLCWV